MFTNQDFIDLMNFCKDKDNFHKIAKKPFDTVYNDMVSNNSLFLYLQGNNTPYNT